MLVYAVLPYAIWIAGRPVLSDYHALLLSTVPGFVYTIGRFYAERSWNVTGMFLIAALLIGTTVDILSGNAEAMIRNNIRTLLAFGLFFLVTMMVNRPMALYFYTDTANALDARNKRSPRTYRMRELMPYFHALTLLFVLRYLGMAAVKSVMFARFGVKGYGLLLWWQIGASWGFGLIIVLASLVVAKRVRDLNGRYDLVNSK